MRTAILLTCAVLALVACGSSAIVQTNRTERYTVQMTLDGQTIGPRTITLHIADRAGAPAAVDQVVVAPVMRDMGMASPEATAVPIDQGLYELRGEPFSMIGEWHIDVRIVAAGREDTTSFTVTVK